MEGNSCTLKLDPLTRAFLDCIHEGERMSAAVRHDGTPRVEPAPEPRGESVCCRCGRHVPHAGRRRSWAVHGEHAWCRRCKMTAQGRAQIRAVQESVGALPAEEFPQPGGSGVNNDL